MSGIFGIIRFDGEAVSPLDLERMSNCLRHRGPDRRKFLIDGPVGLGHCLMRVNREDVLEAQPLRAREAGLLLAADVRIDNREELAEAFGTSAADLALMPDSALILRAYREWGGDCAGRLIGEFAFALWDARSGTLTLARDPMGERCVYFHRNERFLAFATEIKALWAVEGVPRRLSEKEIGRDLMFQFPAGDGETFFEGITFPPGGHIASVRGDGALETKPYWEPRADPTHVGRDEAYYVTAYRRLLAEAVDCRIRRTIAPPALLLSGGFDSAAIAGLAQPRLAAQGRELVAISSVLPEEQAGPDACARHWAELCRRDMPQLDVRYFVQSDENVLTDVERASRIADAPPLGAHYMHDALFDLVAQSGARVVMDGLGGDGTINARLGNVLPLFLRTGQFELFAREFVAQIRTRRRSPRELIKDLASQMIPFPLVRLLWRMRTPEWPIAPAFAASLGDWEAIDYDELVPGPRPYRTPHEKMRRRLRNWIVKNRRNGANEAAAHGLELTRPFRDRRIVELALAIPDSLHMKNGEIRYLARRALADVYPREFLTRDSSVTPFEPRNSGLTSVLPEVKAEFARLAENPTLRRYIDFDAIARKLESLKPRTLDALMVRRTLALAKFIETTLGDNSGRGNAAHPLRNDKDG
jgi:asparagine synthase (glutamine-hydrolysing)